IDLLPMVVYERCRGEDAGLDAQKPSAAAHLATFVEIAGENFLLDTRGIAGRRRPAGVHVDPGELEMWLVHRHGCSPAISVHPKREALGRDLAATDETGRAG